MKQAAELKSKMEAMQAELDHIEVEGTAGGGIVDADAHRQGRDEGRADRRLADQAGREGNLEDLIVAAHADARRKAEALMQEKMKALTGGLPLPPGLKLF